MQKTLKTAITLIILIIASLFPAAAAPVKKKAERTFDYSIGFLKLNSSSGILEKLNIPQPVEESCPHIILNRKENTYIRVTLKPAGTGKFVIDSVRLSNMDKFYQSRRNLDMFMLTGVSLKTLETGAGIKPGSTAAQLNKAYGKPLQSIKNKTSKTETRIYGNRKDDKNLVFILKNNRVETIILIKR
ncbi:MAG: hypothetical protein LWY06_14760 [Firmicutes bacterium]|nr:hypothetical protein [Bacillota bacterium]